jgi:myo-inositol-1-phosphate synthase
MTEKIRVGIIGAGNCASALVQGIEYYRDAKEGEDIEDIPGLMHLSAGGYYPSDVEFSCAFDVDANKVGIDLAKAVSAPPNNTIQFAEVGSTGVVVQRGPTLDGLGQYYREQITEAPGPAVDVVKVLRETGTQVLVNYLPVGSERAARFYAEQALEAGVGLVNCMPVFIASNPAWAGRFADRGVPIIGDDIKSQVGSTIIHRVLAKLFEDRGVYLDRTYQLNFGGNMDFMNMLERERLVSKKKSKTQSVTSQIRRGIEPENVHIGPSDHVPWLDDRKWAHIRLEGRGFGDVPLTVDLKLEVWDSPNSAGIVIDAIRCLRLALDAGVGGPLLGPSAYLMKSPPVQYSDEVARQMVEEFIHTVGPQMPDRDLRDRDLRIEFDEVV